VRTSGSDKQHHACYGGRHINDERNCYVRRPARAKPPAIARQNNYANHYHGDAERLQWARYFTEEERRNQNR
jgi:hypothetical protein